MEQLDDLAARHASHLHRYGTYTQNQILKVLAKVDRRITLQIMDLTDGMTQKEATEFLAGKYSTRRLKQLRESINELAAETKQVTGTILGSTGKDLAGYEVGYTNKVIEASTGIELGATVTASQAHAAAMVKPLQGRHVRDFVRDLEPDFKRKLSAEIRESYLLGENIGTLARRIRGTAQLGHVDGLLSRRNRTIETLVRTSMNHISNVAAQESYSANGVDKIVWRSTLDGRTSKICASRDGNVYDINKGPRPPAHPNCRSTILPYIEGMDWERPSVADKRKVSDIPKSERKDVIKRVDASQNYKQWFDKQKPEFQQEWLGPDRYKLYKKGISLDRFADPRTGKQYNLAQLKKMDKQAFKDAGLYPDKPKVAKPIKTKPIPQYKKAKVNEQHVSGVVAGDVPTKADIKKDLLFKGNRDGVEHATFINSENGAFISTKKGTKNSVNVFAETLLSESRKMKVDIHHNHPNSSSLSLGDLKITTSNGVGEIVAYAHNGDVFKGAAKVSRDTIISGHRSASKEATSALKSAAMFGDIYGTDLGYLMDIDEAGLLHGHLTNEIMAANGDISYSAKFNKTGQELVKKHAKFIKIVLGK